MSTALVTLDQMQSAGATMAKSGLFGVKTVEQAVALMLVAQAEGIHPARAMVEYHVIQGRPALKADAMLARFQTAGGKVEWLDYTNDAVKARFSHPQGGSVEIEWTIAMAKSAGLTGKDVWKQYPRAMLRARVISEGIRTVYPGVAVGVYTPEEIQDFDARPVASGKPGKTKEAVEKDMGAASRVDTETGEISGTVSDGANPDTEASLFQEIAEALDEDGVQQLAGRCVNLNDPEERKRVVAAGKKRLKEMRAGKGDEAGGQAPL